MTVHHGGYVHADGFGSTDPKCPHCTIETLQKQNDGLKLTVDTASDRITELRRDNARLERELREARRALKEYGEHEPDCGAYAWECGLCVALRPKPTKKTRKR